MRLAFLAGWIAVAITASGCGGSSGSSSSPTASPTAPTTAAPVTVNIVGSSGNQAFSPNPVQVPSGTAIQFRNNTSDFHRLVMDSGTVIGDLAPGASSTPMQVGTGGNYHCVTHPSMVGSINGATAPTPPAGSGDGY